MRPCPSCGRTSAAHRHPDTLPRSLPDRRFYLTAGFTAGALVGWGFAVIVQFVIGLVI